MDWIESLLGASPDNGDGGLELLLILVAAAGVAIAAIGAYAPARSAIRIYLSVAYRDRRLPAKR